MTEPTTEPDPKQEEQPWLKELRHKAKEYDALTGEVLPKLKRDFAVLKAGIDTENPVYELFAQSGNVDWDNVEKVREAASKYGLVKQAEGQPQGQQPPQGHQPPQGMTQAEFVAHQQMAAAGEGAQVSQAPTSPAAGLEGAKNLNEFMAQYRGKGGITT